MEQHKSQYIPIILIWMYITLLFCTPLQIYAEIYETWISFIDTFLLTLSVLYYFSDRKYWGFIAKKSLLTVISLNILTELDRRGREIPEYYQYYKIIVSLYLLSLIFDIWNRNRRQRLPLSTA